MQDAQAMTHKLNSDYLRSLTLAQRAMQSGDRMRARSYLQLSPLALRDWEWHALQQEIDHRSSTSFAALSIPVNGLAVSPDGQFVAAFGDAKDGASLLSVWKRSGKLACQKRLTDQVVLALCWDAASASLISIDQDGTASNIDLRADGEVHVFHVANPDMRDRAAYRLATIAPTPNMSNRIICLLNGRNIFVRGLWPPNKQWSLQSQDVRALAFDPQGNVLATGEVDGRVRIWGITSGSCLHTLDGHMGEVTALAFSANGRRLVSGSRDGFLCVWNTVEEREILRLTGPAAGPDALAFFPDGSHLAIASENRITIRGAD
jgi:WD40 repeat protein